MDWRNVLLTCSFAMGLWNASLASADSPWFEIQVLDESTGRGIPLVELITVHDVCYVTDNAGRIAYAEPGHAGRTIHFRVEAQGYQPPQDGFGINGVRLKIESGQSATVKLKRINLAERLYRITGEDQLRDSLLLGKDVPSNAPPGQVAGQDSVQMAHFNGRLYWFWGDTNRLFYPLGLFRTAGATSPLPAELPVQTGLDLRYFTNEEGFARAMVDVPQKEGVVWVDGVCTVADAQGAEHLVAHYSRRPGLAAELDQGTMQYNLDRELFEVVETYPTTHRWQHLADHPIRVVEQGQAWLMWGNPFPVVRVPATWEAVCDRTQYESWTCLADPDNPQSPPARNTAGDLQWRWERSRPTTQGDEQRWLQSKLIQSGEARLLPVDIAHPDDHILMHSGTVRWNPWRRKYVLIAVQGAFDRKAPSALGEVWYSEADGPQGPWRKAIKIVTHDKQTFYNPCHHDLFDEEGGRILYFEGTYCNTFTNSPPTQRYNYNQILYRLDLDRIRLE